MGEALLLEAVDFGEHAAGGAVSGVGVTQRTCGSFTGQKSLGTTGPVVLRGCGPMSDLGALLVVAGWVLVLAVIDGLDRVKRHRETAGGNGGVRLSVAPNELSIGESTPRRG